MVGSGIRKNSKVTGDKKEKSQAPADVNAARERYLDYVRGQLDGLVAQVTDFTNKVKSGDQDGARAMFGQVRTFYERIEPVAESFPDLDPRSTCAGTTPRAARPSSPASTASNVSCGPAGRGDR